MNKTMKHIQGGSVIGSGGFGCIFDPELKCKNKTKKSKGRITKLMKKSSVEKEYKEITRFKPLLDKIPNYSNYFLIDGFSVCVPDKLTRNDLENFNKKCSALKKMKLTPSNINDNLDQLYSLNMPYGGIDVDDYIEKFSTNSNKMISLNHTLIELLQNGIEPMNQKGVLHCDLKSSNILVKEEDNKIITRIIDWGLSTHYNKGSNIPERVMNRPFQYNVPFSNILFNNTFNKLYTSFLKQLSERQTFENTKLFVIDYVLKWVQERGQGHLKTITSILYSIYDDDYNEFNFSMDKTSAYNNSLEIIFKYLTDIIITFTKDDRFDSKRYFSNVFIKNLDVWGFIMTYIPFFEHINITENNSHSHLIKNKFKSLINILITYSDTPINTNEVVELLYSFDNIFHSLNQSYKSNSSKSKSKSKSKKSVSKHTLLISDKQLSINTKKQKKKIEHKFIIKTIKKFKSSTLSTFRKSGAKIATEF